MYSRICSIFTFLALVVAFGHFGVACTSDSKSSAQPAYTQAKSSSATSPLAPAALVNSGSPQSTALLGALTTKGSTQDAKLTREGDTFIVHLPKASQKGQGSLKIESKLGYKVNENFPHRAEFKLSASQTLTAQTKKEKNRLTFTTTEGDISKMGTSVALSFSICNDQMCKLYDEKYQW